MEKIIHLTIVTQRLQNRFNAWADDNSGATAVEFALIATPFFFLVFGLLEVSLIFIVSTTLEFGMNEASRSIRTGTFQNGATPTLASFRSEVCSNLFGLIECNDIEFDIRTFASFNGAAVPSPINPATGAFDGSNFTFSPGAPNQIIIARAFFEQTLVTPILSQSLSNLPGNKTRLISASIAFQNEPFTPSSNP